MRLLTNVAKMTKKPAKNIRFCKIVEISQKIQTWTGIATNHEPVIMQLLTNFLKMAKAKNTRFCKEGQELPKMAKKKYKPEQELQQIMILLLCCCWRMFWKWQKPENTRFRKKGQKLSKIAKKLQTWTGFASNHEPVIIRLLTNVLKMAKRIKIPDFAKKANFAENSQKIQTWTGIAINHEPVIMQLLTNVLKMAKTKNTRFSKEGQKLSKIAKKIQTWTGIATNHEPVIMRLLTNAPKMEKTCQKYKILQGRPIIAKNSQILSKIAKKYKLEQEWQQLMN